MIIVGAGLAGLIAGHVFPTAQIIERSPQPQQGAHRALLRFRSDAVSLLTGIPFRKARVHKAAWWDDRMHTTMNIQQANAYSIKTQGRLLARSVWDLSSVDRWVAPEDLHERMVEACSRRISWGSHIEDALFANGPVVSTMPMHSAMDLWLNDATLHAEFHRSPIRVERWRIPGADVHQTVYVTQGDTSTFRISITGDVLIVESMVGEEGCHDPMGIIHALNVMGLGRGVERAHSLGVVQQAYGKIAPINNALRREIIHRLTTEASVYSVGRFATWRNILLDDVVQDCRIVKGLIEQQDAYARKLRS